MCMRCRVGCGGACRAVYRAAGHVRAMLGGCLCVTHGYDVGVQKCAWCTPWHVSGRGVVGDVHWHVHAMWWWMRCGGPYRAVHRATGHVRGGWLCVTHECDAGVQKCAWCTPWHVSGRGVVGDVYWHVHAMWWWMRWGMQGCT